MQLGEVGGEGMLLREVGGEGGCWGRWEGRGLLGEVERERMLLEVAGEGKLLREVRGEGPELWESRVRGRQCHGTMGTDIIQLTRKNTSRVFFLRMLLSYLSSFKT